MSPAYNGTALSRESSQMTSGYHLLAPFLFSFTIDRRLRALSSLVPVPFLSPILLSRISLFCSTLVSHIQAPVR